MRKSVMRKILVAALVLAVMVAASGGAAAWATTGSQEIEKPAVIPSVSALLANPVYGTEVRIYGKVSLLGELLCPCFELSLGDKTVSVWYDLMVEDDGAQRPPVSVERIENGDWVIVTGELRPSEGQLPSTTFWASAIEKYGDSSDTGRVVEAAVGSLIKVTLESNPTTGFKWELTEISDQTVLEFVESKYEPGEGTDQDLPRVGAGGTEIWSFKTIKQGEATISMEYSQPWDGGMKAAKIFEMTVIVK